MRSINNLEGIESDPYADYNKDFELCQGTAAQYGSTIRLIEFEIPGLRSELSRASSVVDLGAGRGGSTLLVATLCPSAKITVVDDVETLLPEVVKTIGRDRIQNIQQPVNQFLRISRNIFDTFFSFRNHPDMFDESSAGLIANRLNNGGLMIRIAVEGYIPYNFTRFFTPVKLGDREFANWEIWRKR